MSSHSSEEIKYQFVVGEMGKIMQAVKLFDLFLHLRAGGQEDKDLNHLCMIPGVALVSQTACNAGCWLTTALVFSYKTDFI